MEDFQREEDAVKEQIANLQESIEEYARKNTLKNF
jgi:cell division protein FtsB